MLSNELKYHIFELLKNKEKNIVEILKEVQHMAGGSTLFYDIGDISNRTENCYCDTCDYGRSEGQVFKVTLTLDKALNKGKVVLYVDAENVGTYWAEHPHKPSCLLATHFTYVSCNDVILAIGGLYFGSVNIEVFLFILSIIGKVRVIEDTTQTNIAQNILFQKEFN